MTMGSDIFTPMKEENINGIKFRSSVDIQSFRDSNNIAGMRYTDNNKEEDNKKIR